MWEQSHLVPRKGGRESLQTSGARPKSRIPSRRRSNIDVPSKKMKNAQNQQNRTDRYTCTCVEDLEVIEEEHDQCEEQCYEEAADVRAQKSGETMSPVEPIDLRAGSSQAIGEDDPCGEFFDIMRETMENAVKKTLDNCFNQHFTSLIEKMESLREQMERSECIIAKVHADLNDKITFYGERSAQQFQYLCVRMEHDRLFYQQQQEFFLRAVAKCPQGLEFLRGQDQTQKGALDPAAVSLNGCLPKTTAKCGPNERHIKGKSWESTLPTDDIGAYNPSQSCEEEDDKDSEKSTGRAKNRGGTDKSQRRSESAGPTVGGDHASGRSAKKK